jgi:hypothetical protein
VKEFSFLLTFIPEDFSSFRAYACQQQGHSFLWTPA